MRVPGEGLEEFVHGRIFLNEPGIPKSAGAAALLVRWSKIGVEPDIVQSTSVRSPTRSPGGATPKDVFLGFSRNGIWSQLQIAGVNQFAAEGATLRGSPLRFEEPEIGWKAPERTCSRVARAASGRRCFLWWGLPCAREVVAT